MSKPPKKRIYLACPCCGEPVRKLDYSFMVVRPPKFSKYYVCADCKAVLNGNDDAARHSAESAFMDYLEGLNATPTE
jgi:hypothetical protein